MRTGRRHLSRWRSWIKSADVGLRKRNKKTRKRKTTDRKERKAAKDAETSKGRDEKKTRLMNA
jgi:hypothetical protein